MPVAHTTRDVERDRSDLLSELATNVTQPLHTVEAQRFQPPIAQHLCHLCILCSSKAADEGACGMRCGDSVSSCACVNACARACACVRVLACVRMILHCMHSVWVRACATSKQVRLSRWQRPWHRASLWTRVVETRTLAILFEDELALVRVVLVLSTSPVLASLSCSRHHRPWRQVKRECGWVRVYNKTT
jgi:hypothetical protein